MTPLLLPLMLPPFYVCNATSSDSNSRRRCIESYFLSIIQLSPVSSLHCPLQLQQLYREPDAVQQLDRVKLYRDNVQLDRVNSRKPIAAPLALAFLLIDITRTLGRHFSSFCQFWFSREIIANWTQSSPCCPCRSLTTDIGRQLAQQQPTQLLAFASPHTFCSTFHFCHTFLALSHLAHLLLVRLLDTGQLRLESVRQKSHYGLWPLLQTNKQIKKKNKYADK